MQVKATFTERRSDGMQKWERIELPQSDRNRYIWLAPFQSKPGLAIGAVETLEFVKRDYWAGWKITR